MPWIALYPFFTHVQDVYLPFVAQNRPFVCWTLRNGCGSVRAPGLIRGGAVSVASRLVAINERGLRIGQYHHNAKLSDVDVDLVRSLHELGATYRELEARFGVSRWAIGRICRYERRAQSPAGFKRVMG